MSLIIPNSSERRRNLAFAFLFLPSCLAFAAYEALHAQWPVALTALALWLGLLAFSLSHLGQAVVTLVIAVAALAAGQWLVGAIFSFATSYLVFTTFALKKLTPKELSDRLGSLPWLLRPQQIFAKTAEWQAALIGVIVGLAVLAGGLALARFAFH